ncbi:MAG: PspA/IM30 family protein [Desulfobacterales bacterium]|nr:PspA/IM30 family protein [Desulfobacterales bacterium]
MGILNRFIRLCKADIHGIIDQIEDKELLLKQHLREMEHAVVKKETELQNLITFKEQSQKEYQKCKKEIDRIEKEISFSIEKEKDDISRVLIGKLNSLGLHKSNLENHLELLEQKIKKLSECACQQRKKFDELKIKASHYSRDIQCKKWEKNIDDINLRYFRDQFCKEEVELELLKRKAIFKGEII